MQSLVLRLSISLAILLAAVSTSSAGDGFSSELQRSGSHSYQNVSHAGERAERFELRHGDCKGTDRDCATNRERVEARSNTYDKVGETVCYSYRLFIPADYAEMSPKQTLGQWHDTKYGDAFSVRYMNGKMWFSRNLGDAEVDKLFFPISKGSWNEFAFRFRLANDATGSIEAWINGRKVFDRPSVQVLPVGLGRWYFKYGIYRSHLNQFSGPVRPTQVAYYSRVKRFGGGACQSL